MSDVYQSLAHSKWDCKYHVVFVPKRRRKAIFGHDPWSTGPNFTCPGETEGGCRILCLCASRSRPSIRLHP
jgi:hypothetical protein